ncbi:hypothetical protein LMTR13_20860 [Bradyrhizobium icense]|uniref:Uncharacterized protein n=1 Tax=Bradyrhizobium icense TaxID=1274631 RepID=A0A1B1UHM9_9BRAD|nr:hypothetical protein LMTR13_20860 [Bradyrhizobium icense]
MIRQCQTATPLQRLNGTEARAVFNWLIDGGHMTRTGKSLERPRAAPRIEAYTKDGAPIYGAGADFRRHDTVTMPPVEAGRAT